MMFRKNLLVIMTLLIALQVRSQSSPTEAATQTLIFLGAMRWAGHQGMEGLRAIELIDWQSDQTGITAQLGNTCEIITEARLLGTNRHNFMALSMKNTKSQSQTLKVEDILFKFSRGRERRPLMDHYSDFEIKPNQQYVIFLVFPSKTDFKNQTSVTAQLPLMHEGKPCQIEITMNRNPSRPDSVRTVTRATVFDIHMYLGTSQAQGDFRKITRSASSELFGMDLDITGQNWGGFLRYKFNSLSSVKDSVKTAEGIPANFGAQYNAVGLGVLRRQILSEQDVMIYRLGYLMGSMQFSRSGNTDNRITERFDGWTLGAGWKRYFARVDSGLWAGDYSWGIEIGQDILNQNKFSGGTPAGGSLTSVMLSIGVGY